MEGAFNPRQLKKIPWQYTIRHQHVLNFQIGEKVFLKSNPEVPLVVISITSDAIYCRCPQGELEYFLPQTILQYKWAGLQQNDKTGIKICLN